MSVAIITGSTGLVGSESVKFFCDKGFDVIGIDNNLRKYFFGNDGSTIWVKKQLKKKYKNFYNYSVDIRNTKIIEKIFKKYSKKISIIIHCAAQPSHDYGKKLSTN
jgi:CDP-paratose 2-epimerase